MHIQASMFFDLSLKKITKSLLGLSVKIGTLKKQIVILGTFFRQKVPKIRWRFLSKFRLLLNVT